MRGRRPTPLPKFRLLDPVLAMAETLLAQGTLAEVVSALPDEHAAAERLNAVLADAGAHPRLRHADGRWQVAFVGRSGQAEQLLAAEGLIALVVADGWRRIKRCEACGAAFIDRTNGCSAAGAPLTGAIPPRIPPSRDVAVHGRPYGRHMTAPTRGRR